MLDIRLLILIDCLLTENVLFYVLDIFICEIITEEVIVKDVCCVIVKNVCSPSEYI